MTPVAGAFTEALLSSSSGHPCQPVSFPWVTIETSQVHWFLFRSRLRDTTWGEGMVLAWAPAYLSRVSLLDQVVFFRWVIETHPRSYLYIPSLAAGAQSRWDLQVTGAPEASGRLTAARLQGLACTSSVAGLSWTGAGQVPQPFTPLGDHWKSPGSFVSFSQSLNCEAAFWRILRAALRVRPGPAVPSRPERHAAGLATEMPLGPRTEGGLWALRHQQGSPAGRGCQASARGLLCEEGF